MESAGWRGDGAESAGSRADSVDLTGDKRDGGGARKVLDNVLFFTRAIPLNLDRIYIVPLNLL